MKVEILHPVSDVEEKTEAKPQLGNDVMLRFLKKMDYFGYLPVRWLCPDEYPDKMFQITLKKTILIICLDLVVPIHINSFFRRLI